MRDSRLAVPRAQAVDRMWLLTAPDSCQRLVTGRGWSRAAHRRWLVGEIAALF